MQPVLTQELDRERLHEVGRRRARAGVNGFFPQGISVAANQTAAANTDTVQPQSYVGQDAYPGTPPALSTSEQEGA